MHRRGTRGSSILEALGTIAFIGIAVGGFAVNSVSLTRIDKTAASVTEATALAQQQLEALRALPLGAAQLAPGVYTDPANPLAADGGGGGVFDRSWTVSGNDAPRAGLRTVTVRVSWTDSQPHSTRVAAYVRCSTIPCP
jgi:Tfp pilus assembly protein PilV